MSKNKGKVNKKIGAKDKTALNNKGGKKNPNKAAGGKISKKDQVNKLDVFDLFCYWSVRTPDERKTEKLPDTQQEFAKKYKISEVSLSNWKKRDDYTGPRNSKMQEKLAGKTPEVLEGLFKRCQRYGKADEVELWLAYVEGWDKKKVLEMTGKIEFGDGDIRALVEHLPKTKQKLFYDTITKLLIEAETNRAAG